MIFQQLFESGMSFEVFAPNGQDANIEKLLEVYNGIELDEELISKIQSIDKPIYLLAFAELWCPDCIINLPAIKKLNDINPNITFSILPREGNENYMDNYKISGKHKIPTFVVLNDRFEEIGVFIETPKIVKEIVNKGNQVEIIVAKRKYRKGEYIKDTIKEITNIIMKRN
ncbi:thioredoxin family protein [Alkaliphilus sp. MSJ-5]|uniref:Thioredoxin family protein n=1 Tax=Alkaliphilus flagellatus TaxID=2841507 RepID=A0ABS6G6R8_9FIRM|nr:thioredoxin family protein [Alkaliphilus flagellatus]MBU5678173.1 thioredoxin family protein [Alkaliphilus flagellatus]